MKRREEPYILLETRFTWWSQEVGVIVLTAWSQWAGGGTFPRQYLVGELNLSLGARGAL